MGVRKSGLSIYLGVALATVAGSRPAHAAQSSSTPTFTRDVAPIIFKHCTTCHHPTGAAPFNLITYADVRQRATLIAAVVKSRLMPPWKAEPGYGGEFIGQHPLTDAELDTIQRWVRSGIAEGNPRDLPRVPRWTAGWQLGEPDQVVTLSQPYLLPPDGGDVLRVFVIPIPLAAARYVKGLEFRVGNPRVVH